MSNHEMDEDYRRRYEEAKKRLEEAAKEQREKEKNKPFRLEDDSPEERHEKWRWETGEDD